MYICTNVTANTGYVVWKKELKMYCVL